MLEAVTAVEAKDGIPRAWEGKSAGETTWRYDAVLVAIGRDAERQTAGCRLAGVEVDERGFIASTNAAQLVPSPPSATSSTSRCLAHKGVHEGHVATQLSPA